MLHPVEGHDRQPDCVQAGGALIPHHVPLVGPQKGGRAELRQRRRRRRAAGAGRGAHLSPREHQPVDAQGRQGQAQPTADAAQAPAAQVANLAALLFPTRDQRRHRRPQPLLLAADAGARVGRHRIQPRRRRRCVVQQLRIVMGHFLVQTKRK